MTAIEDARAALAEWGEHLADAPSQSRADRMAAALRGLIAEHEHLTTAPPWDTARACFGHCDQEGWYSECVSKPADPEHLSAPPTDDERESLARESDFDVNDDGSILGIPPADGDRWVQFASVSPQIVADVQANPGPESDALAAFAIINSHYIARGAGNTRCAFCAEETGGDIQEHRGRMLVAAGFRRQRPIADAVVSAAYEAFVAGPTDARASMRAALEAARDAS